MLILIRSEQQSLVYTTLNRVANEDNDRLREDILAAITRSNEGMATSNLADELSTKLGALFRGANLADKEERILSSLKFAGWRTRRQAVKEAHSNTFDWMFADSEPNRCPQPGFLKWITFEHGIYW